MSEEVKEEMAEAKEESRGPEMPPEDITFIKDKNGRIQRRDPAEVIQYVGRLRKGQVFSIPVRGRDGFNHDIVFDRVYDGEPNCAWVPWPEIRAKLLIKRVRHPRSKSGYYLTLNDNFRLMIKQKHLFEQHIRILKDIWRMEHREQIEEERLSEIIEAGAEI